MHQQQYRNDASKNCADNIAIFNQSQFCAGDEKLQTVIRESFDSPLVFELPISTPSGESYMKIYQDDTNLVVEYAIGVEDLTAVVILQLPPSEQGRIDAFLTPLTTHLYRVDD